MSKVGSTFGGGAKKPSTAEIFFTLAALQKEKDRLAKLGVTGVGVGGAGGAGNGAGGAGGAGDASLKKFEKGRRTKAGRLKGGRVGGPSSEEEQDNTIKRPGARSAKLLGQ